MVRKGSMGDPCKFSLISLFKALPNFNEKVYMKRKETERIRNFNTVVSNNGLSTFLQ